MAVRPEESLNTPGVKPAGPSDLATCPLCLGPNDCAIANGERSTPCWCVGHSFDSRLFELIPAHDLGRRCVCARCAFDPELIDANRRKPAG